MRSHFHFFHTFFTIICAKQTETQHLPYQADCRAEKPSAALLIMEIITKFAKTIKNKL